MEQAERDVIRDACDRICKIMNSDAFWPVQGAFMVGPTALGQIRQQIGRLYTAFLLEELHDPS